MRDIHTVQGLKKTMYRFQVHSMNFGITQVCTTVEIIVSLRLRITYIVSSN